jgi:glycosyltransferase involved in cell wall biosynthesis
MIEGPVVSIVIPFYKKSSTIHRSVKSVLLQTHENWQLIIVDDCSPEALDWDISWNNYNIDLIKLSSNVGAGLARQAGLDKAKGDYVCFLDADDWWSSNFLMESIICHKLYPDVIATWCERIQIVDKIIHRTNYSSAFDHKTIIETLLKYKRPWQTGGLMWKRSQLGTWSSLKVNEDSLFELSNALNNNRVQKVKNAYLFQDMNPNYSLSKSMSYHVSETTKLELWLFVWFNLWHKLSFDSKLILINRMSAQVIKLLRLNVPIVTNSFHLDMQLPIWIRFPYIFPYKVISKVLQRSKYRFILR